MAPRRLKNLSIHEVSSVDRGAGENVRVMLMKRAGVAEIDWAKVSKAVSGDDLDLADELTTASVALSKSIASISADASVKDKDAAVAKTVQDFNDHITALLKAAGTQQENDMDAVALQKKIDADAIAHAAALAAEVTKREAVELELAISKMSPDAKALVAKMTPEEKKKFAAQTKDEQDEEAATAKRAAVITIDPAIQKRLDQADADRVIIKQLQEKDEIAVFAKRAKDIGLPEAHGEVMRKAYGGDVEAQKKHDDMFKAVTEQARVGKLFAEVGKGGDGSANAEAELQAKATELRKADPKLSVAQAYDAAYIDPANAEIVKRVKEDEIKKRAA